MTEQDKSKLMLLLSEISYAISKGNNIRAYKALIMATDIVMDAPAIKDEANTEKTSQQA